MGSVNKFSINLSKLAEEKRITQTALAEFLRVSQQTISKYMNGKIEPNIDTLLKLADFFEVSCDYMLGFDDLTKEEMDRLIRKKA